jgi:hypothetical protein
MSATPAHHADPRWREPFVPGPDSGRSPMGRHEALARTAAALDAQRVELYTLNEPADAVLVGLWTPFEAPIPTQPTRVRVPQS